MLFLPEHLVTLHVGMTDYGLHLSLDGVAESCLKQLDKFYLLPNVKLLLISTYTLYIEREIS